MKSWWRQAGAKGQVSICDPLNDCWVRPWEMQISLPWEWGRIPSHVMGGWDYPRAPFSAHPSGAGLSFSYNHRVVCQFISPLFINSMYKLKQKKMTTSLEGQLWGEDVKTLSAWLKPCLFFTWLTPNKMLKCHSPMEPTWHIPPFIPDRAPFFSAAGHGVGFQPARRLHGHGLWGHIAAMGKTKGFWHLFCVFSIPPS